MIFAACDIEGLRGGRGNLESVRLSRCPNHKFQGKLKNPI